MQTMKKYWTIAGLALVLAVLAGWSAYQPKATAPAMSTDTATSTATSTLPVGEPTITMEQKSFALNAADTIKSWDFKGAYTGNATFVAQADADIKYLIGLLGGGKYDDYDLYNGIANDYTLLGDGMSAYQYYNRSISIHPSKGLAYVNLAHLMDEIGAYHTAADAYARAVAVEPETLEYHIERLTFLTRQFSNDNTIILAAFTDASKQFGDTPAILSIEAQWLTDQKRYADAIKAWETVKMLSPESRQAAIDTEIARLKAKQ